MARKRRFFLNAGFAASAVLACPAISRGQATEKVVVSLATGPRGQTAYMDLAQAKGYWAKRGLEVEIVRGNGSPATTTAVSSGRTQFGLVQMPSIVLSRTPGASVVCIAIAQYDSTLGVGVLEGSPIREPKDIEGRTLTALSSGIAGPLLPLYAQRNGIDITTVKIVNVDSTLNDQLVLQKKADGLLGTIYANVPAYVSEGYKIYFMPYRKVGIELYGLSVIAARRFCDRRPDLCRSFVDGLMEGIRDTLLNPDEALDIYLKANPDMVATKAGQDFARLGIGIFLTTLGEEVTGHPLGWADPTRLGVMTDLIGAYLAQPGAARIDPTKIFRNDFTGQIALTPAEVEQVRHNMRPFLKFAV